MMICHCPSSLSKSFNGTLMMQRDENGQIIKESVVKFDLRGELGVAVELCKQAVPVIANECIVRAFYFYKTTCNGNERKMCELPCRHEED